MLRGSRRGSATRAVTVITRAGISAESGGPTFRGANRLWRSFRPEDLATPQAFARDPQLIWDWYRWRRSSIATAAPNPGHEVLARWDARIRDDLLLTQNVDGLHTRAGAQRLVELHGNIWRARCTKGAVGFEAGGGGRLRWASASLAGARRDSGRAEAGAPPASNDAELCGPPGTVLPAIEAAL